MLRFIMKTWLIVALSTLFYGCGEDTEDTKETTTTTTANLETLTVESLAISASTLYPNTIESVDVSLYSPEALSVDNNDSPLFFFFSLQDVNDANNTIWFDSDSLATIEEGSNTYTFDIVIPPEINASRYRLSLSVSDSNNTIDDYNASEVDVLESDGKPDIEIQSVVLDLGFNDDSEFDTISSSDINSTAISQLVDSFTSLGVEISDENSSLDLSATLTVISNRVDANDVNVTVCIEMGSECVPLPIGALVQRDENTSVDAELEDNATLTESIEPTYISQIELGYLEANEPKSVTLDLVLDEIYVQNLIDTLADLVVSDPSSALDAKLKVSIVTSDESSIGGDNNLLEYPLSFFLSSALIEQIIANAEDIVSDITDSVDDTINSYFAMPLSREVSGDCGLKKLEYTKEKKRYKYGKRFGAGAYLKGRGWLDGDGAHSKIYASIRVRRFSSTKHRIFRMSATADIIPDSFSDTGYSIELSSLGNVFYTNTKSLLEQTGLDEPVVELTTEEEARITNPTTSDSNTTVTTRETLLKQKRIKAVKDELNTYKTSSTTNISLIALENNWRIGKYTERKTTIMFAIIPIVVTAGAEARLGYDTSIGLDGITSLSAMIEPNAYVGAYLEAGVGAGISCCWVSIDYSAGFGSNLWLVSERFTTTVTSSLDLVQEGDYITAIDGNFHMDITNYLSTMSGSSYAYASYYGPYRWSEPTKTDWKQRKRTKTFASWNGSKYTTLLLNRSWNLFSIPLADECN